MAIRGASKKRSSNNLPAFNQSRTKLYLRCRKAYWFRYDLPVQLGYNGELVLTHSSLPLKKGDWCHQLLEAHWREQAGTGGGWEKAQRRLTKEFNKLFDEEKERYGDLPAECDRLFRGYLRRWRDDDEHFAIATLPNGRPAVEFTIEVPLDRYGIPNPFKGKVDILVEDLEYGGYWIRDAKWVSRIPNTDERMMSPQALIYTWAVRKSTDLDVRGFIFDYGRTKEPTSILTPTGKISNRKNLDTDVATFVAGIKQVYGDSWRKIIKSRYRERYLEVKNREVLWYRRERIPVEPERVRQGLKEFVLTAREIQGRNKADPPRTYLPSCRWHCDYHDLCVAEFTGLDIDPLIRRRYTVEEERYEMVESDLFG